MYLFQLTRISLRSRPDVQTVTYAQRVPEWLSQWTVANNFGPVLMDGREASDIDYFASVVVNRFLANMRHAVPELMKRGAADHAADFVFDFNVSVINLGVEAKYVACGSFHGDRGFPAKSDTKLGSEAAGEVRQ